MTTVKLVQQDGVIIFACAASMPIDWFIDKCKTELPDLDNSAIIGLYNGQRQIIDEDFVTCKTITVFGM